MQGVCASHEYTDGDADYEAWLASQQDMTVIPGTPTERQVASYKPSKRCLHHLTNLCDTRRAASLNQTAKDKSSEYAEAEQKFRMLEVQMLAAKAERDRLQVAVQKSPNPITRTAL